MAPFRAIDSGLWYNVDVNNKDIIMIKTDTDLEAVVESIRQLEETPGFEPRKVTICWKVNRGLSRTDVGRAAHQTDEHLAMLWVAIQNKRWGEGSHWFEICE